MDWDFRGGLDCRRDATFENDLVEELISLTQLPRNMVEPELVRLFLHSGVDPNEASLEDVRAAVAALARDVLFEFVEQSSKRSS
jgi:hypothetical protein